MPAASYHAGLPEKRRHALQASWMQGLGYKVLVATVAFGLGVDNPHVRFVVHFSLTKTIEGAWTAQKLGFWVKGFGSHGIGKTVLGLRSQGQALRV